MPVRAVRLPMMLAAVFAFAPALAAPPAEPNYDGLTPEQARAKLNREQAIKAQEQLASNAANKRAYEEATVEREQIIRRTNEMWEAEKVAYDSAMAQWQEIAAACRAGDRSRCHPGSQ